MSQVVPLTKKNLSGIYPAANRILIKPDEIETHTAGSIELPDWVRTKYEQGQASGTLVAVGPDAFSHTVERIYRVHANGTKGLVEERKTGYSEPFASIGDRVAFAKYTGLRVKGEDGQNYIILNDEDITARISDGVEFTDLDTRKGMGVK